MVMCGWLKQQGNLGLGLFPLTPFESESSVMAKTASVLFPTESPAMGQAAGAHHVLSEWMARWIKGLPRRETRNPSNSFVLWESVSEDGDITFSGNYWESWDYNLVPSKCFFLTSFCPNIESYPTASLHLFEETPNLMVKKYHECCSINKRKDD